MLPNAQSPHRRYDRDTVRAAFAGRMLEFAAAHWPGTGVVKRRGHEMRVDGNGGLDIKVDGEGNELGEWYHHGASIGGDGIDLAGYHLHGSRWNRRDARLFVEALNYAAEWLGVEPEQDDWGKGGTAKANGSASANGATGSNGSLASKATPPQLVRPPQPAPPPSQRRPGLRRVWQGTVGTYVYCTAEGEIAYHVDKAERIEDGERRKDFPVWHQSEDGTELTGYGPHGPVLYNLPDLEPAITSGQTVFLCEGEKDADNLRERFGLVTTTAPGGAGAWGNKHAPRFAAMLEGAHVVCLPDADKPGREGMAAAVQRLGGVAASVRVLDLWPERTDGSDVSDWLEAGATADELETRLEEIAPEPEPDPDAELFRNAFFPMIEGRPEPSEPRIRLMGERVGSAGNLSLLSALQGSGKSSICEALCAKAINPACDGLGYSVPLETVVWYIDTEQSEEDHLKSWDRMRRRAGLAPDEYPPEHVRWVLIATEPEIDARQQILWRLCELAADGVLIVDALADFVLDINDLKEVMAFLFQLMARAKANRVSVFGLIHPNPQPGNDKPMGHLGSVAMRRAESVFTLITHPETEVRTITAKRTRFALGKNRSGPRTMESSFCYDSTEGVHMMVTCDPPEEGTRQQGAVADLRGLAREAFEGRVVLRRFEVVARLMEITGTKKDNCESKVSAMARAGLIEKHPDGSGYLLADLGEPPWEGG